MLAPKRVRRRKVQKGRMRGFAYRGSNIDFGDYGLQATTRGFVSARQIEAAPLGSNGCVGVGALVGELDTEDVALVEEHTEVELVHVPLGDHLIDGLAKDRRC